MRDEIWVLGATGRVGRAVAARLHNAGFRPVLVGRERARLESITAELGGEPRIVVGALDTALSSLAQAAQAVVVNTIGPFTDTAPQVVRACPPGTHYVDVANELAAVSGVLDLNEQTVATNRTLVTGAGFGVLATESVVLQLCAGQPPAARVRVDALASVGNEPGVIGSALAASIIDGLASGGRRVERDRMVRSRLAGDLERLTTPDGITLSTASLPSGELVAAWRASGAVSVVAASSLVPTAPTARAMMLAISALIRLPMIRRFATSRLARVPVRAHERPREFSWAHARVEWATGATREGWLRTGDGMAFTAAVTADVARRLARDETRSGAYTPGALFGPSLATDAGGQFILERSGIAH